MAGNLKNRVESAIRFYLSESEWVSDRKDRSFPVCLFQPPNIICHFWLLVGTVPSSPGVKSDAFSSHYGQVRTYAKSLILVHLDLRPDSRGNRLPSLVNDPGCFWCPNGLHRKRKFWKRLKEGLAKGVKRIGELCGQEELMVRWLKIFVYSLHTFSNPYKDS